VVEAPASTPTPTSTPRTSRGRDKQSTKS
jgi:hypothetical protein